MRSQTFHSLVDSIWDFACTASIIGIWPRFIEPKRLSITKIDLPIKNLPSSLNGLTILQFSDLHFHPKFSSRFLDKVSRKIASLKPDLIAFTGDFICYGELADGTRLQKFLQTCSAPYGCYAILGNHDYAQAVTCNEAGDYDTLQKKPSAILKGLNRLFVSLKATGHITERAKAVPFNSELLELLKNTPFELLHNQSKKIPVKESFLNVCGLGEYMLGRCQPVSAFQKYDAQYPGIILAHNPDAVSLLADYPGELILSGHTHGGQINLPWVWKKFTIMENMDRAQAGLYQLGNKYLYVSRGLGSVLPFRLRATPELVLMTLKGIA
jgi:uncharacterized protein